MSDKITNKSIINQASEVQAMRRYLGLETREVSALVGRSMRSWQYWEKGVKAPPQDVLHLLDSFCQFVTRAVELAKEEKLTSIPYFTEYDDFCKTIPEPSQYKWQLWQRIVGLIRINNYCTELSNTGTINIKWKFANFFIDYFKKRNGENHD